MRHKIAIFDMDGTILNTLTDISNAINHTLEAFNMPKRSVDEVRSFVGNGLDKLCERAVVPGTDAKTLSKVITELRSYYGTHSNEATVPYDGITDVIRQLKADGIKTAVVSNKAHTAVLDLVDIFYDGLFDYAIGEHKGFAPKPAPDMIDEILLLSGCTNSEAVYIGDSDVDLQTAQNSNMDCIAVSWGFRSIEFLKAHGATTIADSPKELLNLI